MKIKLILLALAGLFLADTATRPQDRVSRDAVRHGWHSTLEEGKAEARRTGKPLMVVLRCEP